MYIHKNPKPPNPIKIFSYNNFTGGLCNASTQLKDNEASDILNMKFVDDTLMEKRNGICYHTYTEKKKGEDGKEEEVIKEYEFPADNIIFIDEFKPHKDADKFMCASEKALYVDNKKICDLKGRIYGANYSGKYYFVDSDKLRVYGKYFQKESTYEKIIGTAKDEYLVFEVVDPPKDFKPLDKTHTEGVTKVDYTNLKVWYEPCLHEVEDTWKNGNAVPQQPKYLVAHADRLYVAGIKEDDDSVTISDVLNPLYYPASLPIRIPQDSDQVVALAVYDNSLIIGRQKDIYVLTGRTNRPDLSVEAYDLKRLNTHTGMTSMDNIRVAHNYLIFVGSDNKVYALTDIRNGVKSLSTVSLSDRLDLNLEPIKVKEEDVRKSVAIFYDDEYLLQVGNKTLVYSYKNTSWTMYTGLDAKYFYNHLGTLIWCKSDTKLYKFSDNYMDFDRPFKSLWASKYFDMGYPTLFKHFRDVFLVAHTYAEFTSDVNVNIQIDYIDIYDKISIKDKISIWGKSSWGDKFSKRNVNASNPFRISRRGRNIRFVCYNGYEIEKEVEKKSDLYDLPKKHGQVILVKEDKKIYVYENYEWLELPYDMLNQSMKVVQINGEYEVLDQR